jgi:hypothetical protein
MLEKCLAAHGAGRLRFLGSHAHLADAKTFAAFLAPLSKKRWFVYAKRPFAGPKAVLAYLSRYTHRVAISNRRLIAINEHSVTFKVKNYRTEGSGRYTTMTLDVGEFIRRFLIHVLPKGFHRIRHYGFPQTPSIKSQQQTEGALNHKQKTETETKPTDDTAEMAAKSTQSKTANEAYQAGDEASEFTTLFNRRIKITDLLLVIFTAGLFVATIFLWLATRDLVQDAKENSERQLRAYITAANFRLECPSCEKAVGKPKSDPIDMSDPNRLIIYLQNSGETPAYEVSVKANFHSVPIGQVLPSDFSYPDVPRIRSPRATAKKAEEQSQKDRFRATK